MVSTVLQAAKASIAAKFDAAIASAQALEGMPSQETNPTLCDVIASIKQDLNDKIEVCEDLEVEIPCGQMMSKSK